MTIDKSTFTLIPLHIFSSRLFYAILLFLGIWLAIRTPAGENSGRQKVMVIKIDGEIQRGVVAYINRAIDKAEDERADYIIMLVNTPGGSLDAALDIKDALLNSETPVLALIDRQAFSAGALISIAAQEIYMVNGAVIGAATPVTGNSAEKASEKVVSAVRKAFAATAEYRNRNPRIAEAMVDESIEIAGVVEKGKLLTLTASEAKEWGYTEGIVKNFDDLLSLKGLSKARIVNIGPALSELVVGFLTNSVVSSLLISLGLLGLLYEIISPGWGIGGTFAVIFLGMFFWSHFLTGLAGLEGLALVLAGIILLAVEAFLIPGFGVAGILGFIALVGGLFISLIGDFSVATSGDFLRAGYILLGAIGIFLIGSWGFLTFLPRKRSLGGLFLSQRLAHDTEDVEEQEAERTHKKERLRVGSTGMALTDLRPAGTAMFDDQRADVVTEGQFISAGTPVELIIVAGNRLVVRSIEKTGSKKRKK